MTCANQVCFNINNHFYNIVICAAVVEMRATNYHILRRELDISFQHMKKIFRVITISKIIADFDFNLLG